VWTASRRHRGARVHPAGFPGKPAVGSGLSSEASGQTAKPTGNAEASLRLLLWFVLAASWFGCLGYRDITHPDEGRYSEISREMASNGDWVTPRLNGLKYFEKPPLQYWATALLFKGFGESEFVARLWVGLCGFATVLVVYRTAHRLWGAETADYAGIACASMVSVTSLSHIVTLDMGVTFFMTLALCGFLLANHDAATEDERRRWMWTVWAAMAGALLSKGLIGVVCPAVVLILYSTICRDWRPWARLQPFSGVAIFAALAVPWHVLVALRNPEWERFYFIHEHVERFLTTEHHRAGAWYYFLPLLVLGLLPWTTLLPQILRCGWRADSARFQTNRFLLIWSVFIFVFFSCSGSKLPAYILPIFPALALLLGRVLVAAKPGALRGHGVAIAVLMAAIAVGALILGGTGIELTRLEVNQAFWRWLLAGAAALALMSAIAVRAASAKLKLRSVLLLAAGSLLFVNAVLFGYQSFSPLVSSAELARKVRPMLDAHTPVFSVRYYDQTLPFYLKRTVTLVEYVNEFDMGEQQEPEKWVHDLQDFARRWRELSQGFAVMDHATFASLRQQGLPMQIVDQTPRRVVVRRS
jgi:4-amino-4-deoxy-L-arabinose transferase-like glycosyltransferase